MFQSRDEIRKVYASVWQKLQQGQILQPMEAMIADIIKLHPEYQSILENEQQAQQAEFDPDKGQSNPFLHMGMHIAIREQISIDQPRGIRDIHQKLWQRMGIHDAEHAMIECLGQALWMAQHNQGVPDNEQYLECLRKIG